MMAASTISAGWSSPVARQAHNLKVASSNLAPATNFECRSESNQRQSRNGWGALNGSRKTIYRRNGVVSRRAMTRTMAARGEQPRAQFPFAGASAIPRLTMSEKRPPGVALLFASRAEINAAPTEEREAYYRIVEGFLANPEAYGFRYETAADFAADDRADAELGEDWGTA